MKAVILALIVSIFIISLCGITAAANRYVQNAALAQNTQRSAFAELDTVSAGMQDLCGQSADIPGAGVVQDIEDDCAAYSLSITDISSGINTRFFPETILSDEKVRTFLSADKAAAAVVSYGWINISVPNTKALAAAEKSFGTTDVQRLFPLVNNMPLTNVYYLPDDCLSVLLDSLSIHDQVRRTAFLDAVQKRGLTDTGSIKKILGISHNGPALAVLGVKTAFWKITFIYQNTYRITGVLAAVPSQEDTGSPVLKYILVERQYAVL